MRYGFKLMCLVYTVAQLVSDVLLVQTLKHADRRAAYDAVVGISGDAINPFTDTSFERDQVRQYATQCLHACMYAFAACALSCLLPSRCSWMSSHALAAAIAPTSVPTLIRWSQTSAEPVPWLRRWTMMKCCRSHWTAVQ